MATNGPDISMSPNSKVSWSSIVEKIAFRVFKKPYSCTRKSLLWFDPISWLSTPFIIQLSLLGQIAMIFDRKVCHISSMKYLINKNMIRKWICVIHFECNKTNHNSVELVTERRDFPTLFSAMLSACTIIYDFSQNY